MRSIIQISGWHVLSVLLIIYGLPLIRAKVEVVYCHLLDTEDAASSTTSGVRYKPNTTTLYHIKPYPRDQPEPSGLINCTWNFTVTDKHIGAMTMVLELQRKTGGGQVAADDAFSNLAISVGDIGSDNRTTHALWSNLSLLLVKNGSSLTVSLTANRRLGASMDNRIFIRLFLVGGSSCPGDNELFHLYGNFCLTVRPANFICAANEHLINCPLMTKMAIQVTLHELTELVQNVSFNKKFSVGHSLPSQTVISGFLCKDRTFMAWDGTGGVIPGKLHGISKECTAASGVKYLTVHFLGSGNYSLTLVSEERASRLSVLLAIRLDPATATLNVPSVSNNNPWMIITVLVVGLAIFAVIVVIAIYKRRLRGSNEYNTAGALENGHGENEFSYAFVPTGSN